MSVDTETIKDQMPMDAVCEKLGIDYRKARKGGVPCPSCGGKDRFQISNRDLFCCCQCHPQFGDQIEMVMHLHGMDFQAAVKFLGGEESTMKPETVQREVHADASGPTTEWKKEAAAFAGKCAAALQADGDRAKEFLAKRGITPETARAFRLGHCADKNAVVIPWISELGAVDHVKFRSIDPNAKLRFWSKDGGRPTLYGLAQVKGDKELLLIIEGEMNAVSAWQDSKLCDVVSPGSKSLTEGGAPIAIALSKRYRLVIVWADEPEDAAKIAKELHHKNCFTISSAKVGGVKYDANEMLKMGAGEIDKVLLGVLKANGQKLGVHIGSTKNVGAKYTPKELAESATWARRIVENSPPTSERALALTLLEDWDEAIGEGHGVDFVRERKEWVTVLAPFIPGLADIPRSGQSLHDMARSVLV